MHLIAHKGLLHGPNPDIENSPDQVEYALSGGYGVKVDVWLIEQQWFLGQLRPVYKVPSTFIRQSGLWLQCRNYAALDGVARMSRRNYFWHDADSYTLTSKGFIWAFPSQPISELAICVMPEWEDETFSNIGDITCAGFCSEYIVEIDNKLHDRRP